MKRITGYPVFLLLILLLALNCTKLNENYRDALTNGQVALDSANTAALLQGVYNSMEDQFTSHLNSFALNELSTDEAIAPTRGKDWDDNGIWRALHEQKWNTNNDRVVKTFYSLNGTVFAATDLLKFHPTVQQQAEARLIRAWAMYLILDMFDQVPYRDPGESVILPSRVRSGVKALDYIISEIDSVSADLPEGPASVANKYAADFLLMKCFLNKAVYVNRANPQFDPEDMNRVIILADRIINSGKFHFSANYFDNFAPDNSNIGSENIFTLLNDPGSTPNNSLILSWIISFHYAQPPGGANGFATLSDFYKKFDSSDIRKGFNYPTTGAPPNPGNRITVGFFTGQQYNPFDDSPIYNQNNVPVFFTPDVKNIEQGNDLEFTGYRPLKYAIDWPNIPSPGNDFVFFRFPDVLLMKAEAILRGGTPTDAGGFGKTQQSLVNSIRTHPSRNAQPLSTVSLETLLDERGRELWWEGWRRQDMIRFKTFLNTFQEKDYVSDPKYLLFPIPDDQISANRNLVQNPGY